jgi:Acetyltransferase (GNAT) domain
VLDVVWKRSLLANDRDDYDRFVAEATSGHYAQTRAFEAVVRASRPSIVRYFLARDAGRVVGAALVVRAALGPLGLPSAVVERGPVCRDVGDLARVSLALVRTARRHGIVRLSVMPYWADEAGDAARNALVSAGFRDSQRPDGAHARTLRIDLVHTTDEGLLSAPGQERLRRRSTQAVRAGAMARPGTRLDLDMHRLLTEKMMRAQGRSRRSVAYYDALWAHVLDQTQRGALFVCEHEERTVATVLVLRHGGIAVYAEGATTLEPSPITKSVPPLLAAVRWARAEGCHTFDLGGIPLEDDTDSKRRRIAHLKLDFARVPVRLVHEHTRLF